MVNVKEDLTGQHFERLKVIRQAEDYISPKGVHTARWECECSCEDKTIVFVLGTDLKQGKVLSCGCLNKEKLYKRNKKYNKYDLSGEYGVGWTSNTNKEFYFDLEDYDKIKDYCWREIKTSNTYQQIVAHEPKNNKQITLHQIIFDKYADHINRNTFDNRKVNLRPANKSQNTYNSGLFSTNTSGIRGVNKSKNRYRAYIGDTQEGTYLVKYFDNKELAVLRRLTWELMYAGEYAPQLELIQKEYPYLLNYFKIKETMTFTDDMQTILDVGICLKQDPHCPCSLIKNDNTLCPCIACRNKQQCHCGMFVSINTNNTK